MESRSFIRYLFIAVLLFIAIDVSAQTFYELKFHVGENNEEFVGLLIYTDNEHCKMRLVDNEAIEKNGYYESNYTCQIEAKEGKDDVGVMMLLPDNDDLPMLIWYWEKDDVSDMSEAPLLAYDLDDTDSWIETDSFREISLEEMNLEFIDMFYDESSPEYKMLIQGVNVVKKQRSEQDITIFNERVMEKSSSEEKEKVTQHTPIPVENHMGTLHLIIVANTEVSDIGPACSIDMRRIRSEFTGVAKALKLDLEPYIVSGNDYSKTQVQNAISVLSPSKNDVVVFVYSGHGFRFKDQKDYYPCLDLTSTAYDKLADNFIPLSNIYEELVAKGARLNIVLSDCCNSEVTQEQPMIWSNSLFSRANTNFDLNKLEMLFIKSSGNVIATAASPGEYSWCGTNGGFFLLSFLESLRSQISALTEDMPSWDTLIDKTIASAALKTENNANCMKQNGLKKVTLKN